MDNQENSENALLPVGDVIIKAINWKLTEVEIPEKKSNKFLQFAASYGLTHVCESLLLRGYDINGGNSLGWTPLMQAASAGHNDVVKLLINSGGKLNILNGHGVGAFAVAAAKGNLQIMQILRQENRNLEQNDYDLRSALEVCCLNGHLTCVKWLVFTTCVDYKGPSIHNGYTPLMLAVLGGHTEIVRFLLGNKCDLTVRNNFHQTAMDIAVFKKDSSMVELFTVYTIKLTSLQLPLKSVKPSISCNDITGHTGLPPGKENTGSGTYIRICNNSENLLSNSSVNNDKINCRCKLSPENRVDRFNNVYFQFPSLSCSEPDSYQSISSSTICASHEMASSADSMQTLISIISPRYFCSTCQKVPDSSKKRQFSAVTGCSTWLTKFVKRRSKSVNDSGFSSLNSPLDQKLHNKKGVDFSHVFHGLGLQEYWPVFKEKELDLVSFLTLTEDDLETMGITREADKCKILYAIQQLRRSSL